jgi:hypothetical protein
MALCLALREMVGIHADDEAWHQTITEPPNRQLNNSDPFSALLTPFPPFVF